MNAIGIHSSHRTTSPRQLAVLSPADDAVVHQLGSQSHHLCGVQPQLPPSFPPDALCRLHLATARRRSRRRLGGQRSTSDSTQYENIDHDIGDVQDEAARRFTGQRRFTLRPDCCQVRTRLDADRQSTSGDEQGDPLLQQIIVLNRCRRNWIFMSN